MIRSGENYLYDLRPAAYRLDYYFEKVDCILSKSQIAEIVIAVTETAIVGRNRVNFSNLILLVNKILRKTGTTLTVPEVIAVLNPVYNYLIENVMEEFAIKVYYSGAHYKYTYDSEAFMLNISWEPKSLLTTPYTHVIHDVKIDKGSSVELDDISNEQTQTRQSPIYYGYGYI